MSKINKIVELLADIDGEEFDDIAVEIMSLVEEPAIGVHWAVFAAEQFVDKVAGESKDDYLGRCIPQLIKEGYDQDQAAAICYDSFQVARSEDKEMVDGVIDLLNKVEDLENRMKMAHDIIRDFGQEGVDFDVEDFMIRIGFDINVDALPPYTDETDDLKKKEEFESYTDYPEGARNNAKRAIEWKEKNGSDCGTQVGWTRARQLADGKPISEETIARMASFERHRQNSDVPYSEGCGGIMWDAWGGDSGIRWAQTKLKSIREEQFQNKILEMASQEGFGEVLDMEMTTYVNLTRTNFETIGEFLRGIDAIDILGQIQNSGAEQMPEPSYRYTGPIGSNSRDFCRTMIGLGKIYTRTEIQAMSSIPFQPGMGPGGSNTYNIFNYKGGVNCQHFWEQVRVFRSPGGRNIVISEGPAAGDAGEVADSGNNYWRMSADKTWQFSEDDEKRIITGPAMKAFQMIPRRDENGNLFHVYFSDETIKKLSEKFLRDHKQHMTDIDHSMEATEENTLVESWIVEDPEMDKSRALGFNPSKGDWYVSYKINNDETWQKIKDGSLTGFSIAGQFLERHAK